MKKTTFINILGVIALAVGIIGFFSQPTLGVFVSNTWQNLLYIVAGLIALTATAVDEARSVISSKILGYIFTLAALLGFVTGQGTMLGFIDVNFATNILHLAMGVAFLAAGYVFGYTPTRESYQTTDTRMSRHSV